MTQNDKPRRMNEEYAAVLVAMTRALQDSLETWREEHPNVADWRVEEAHSKLARVARVLTYLWQDEDPEGDAARAELMRKRPELFEGDVPRETSG